MCFPAPIRAAEACRVPFLVCLESESEREVAQSCPTLCDPWTVGHQAPPSMAFSRQEHWSGLPFPSPGDLPVKGSRSDLPGDEGSWVYV